MKLWQNILGNIAVIGVQVYGQMQGAIPAKYAWIGGLAQAVLAVVAHNYNTDGSPQSQAGPK